MAAFVLAGLGGVRDAVGRDVCRVVALLAGLVMLTPVFHVEPGVTRQICALSAAVLLVSAAWPRRSDGAATRRDVVELEKAIMQTRAEAEAEILRTRQDVEIRAEAFGQRLDGITEMVAEIGDQVR